MPAPALIAPWTTPFGLPPFGQFAAEDFREAFQQALAEDRADVEAIAADPAASSFTTVIDGLERAGQSLRRITGCFYNLVSADANDTLQAIEREMAPVMARHRSQTLLDARLFAKIDVLYTGRDQLGLSAEQAQVLERYHRLFTRAGAGLDEAGRARMGEIAERLAVLSTQFSQNVLADERAYELVLAGDDDLAGLPDFLRAAALAAGA